MIKPLLDAYVRFKMRNSRFPGSREYWEQRYNKGGDSGPGSYDRLALFKAEVMNDLVRTLDVRSVVELGCGDGNQLGLIAYPKYLGLDVSATAVRRCIALYPKDPTKSFMAYMPDAFNDPAGMLRADMAISLDVLFHLVEQEVFDLYMTHLFGCAQRYVVIYARDKDGTQHFHERDRSFTRHIAKHFPEWTATKQVPNPYPFDPKDPKNTSDAGFHVFARRT